MLWALILAVAILAPAAALFAALCGLLGRLAAYPVLLCIPKRKRN